MTSSTKKADPLLHIPTTIITGFLGAGKTTLINHLLSVKPPSERWAVVVNEFGKIGVDGALLGTRDGVSIKEIPGGCLCCSAGQAFEAGLNRLIRIARPNRILIEPTGIGHPLKIISTLTSGYYRAVLDLKATICLVDARKLGESRYSQHPAFRDQQSLADILVASKSDCYSAGDLELFMNLAESFNPKKLSMTTAAFGKLSPFLLDMDRDPSRTASYPLLHETAPGEVASPAIDDSAPDNSPETAPDSWVMLEGSGAGYFTGSWQVGRGYRFQRSSLSALLRSLHYLRIKGVMQCSDGWISLNATDGEYQFSPATPARTSRLEIIDSTHLPCIEIDAKLRGTLGE